MQPRKHRLTVCKPRTIVGPNYRQSCDRCDSPPWEPCKCSGLLNIEPARNEPVAKPRQLSIVDLLNMEADARLAFALGGA